MSEYTRAEAAERAALPLDYLDQLIRVGVVTPDADDRFTTGDVRRAQMAKTLADAGIPLDGLGEAIRGGNVSLDFMDSPVYDRFASHSAETYRQVADRTGIPMELLLVIREAVGSAPPGADDLMREDELAVIPLVAANLALGFSPKTVERSLRVYGDSLRRVAETDSDAWRNEVMGPMLAQGMTAAQIGAASTGADTQRMDEALDAALLAILHAQQARAWTSNIIGGLETQLAEAGIYSRVSRPPAVCFLDITGYTRLTQERGDEAAASLAERLGRVVTRTTMRRGGKPVKWLGDGVMVYFREPGPSVVAALDMVDGVADAGLPPAHVGVHAGPVLFQEGDYFGQTVNLASRIADYARPGEVIVTQAVVDACAGAEAAAGATFVEIGPVELKGISGAVSLHAAHRAS